MIALTVQTFTPNVYLLVLLALLDRLVLSPMITQRLGPKAARRDDTVEIEIEIDSTPCICAWVVRELALRNRVACVRVV